MGCLNSQSNSWQCKHWAPRPRKCWDIFSSYVLTLPACVFRLKYGFCGLWSKLSILELRMTWNFWLNHMHHEEKNYIFLTHWRGINPRIVFSVFVCCKELLCSAKENYIKYSLSLAKGDRHYDLQTNRHLNGLGRRRQTINQKSDPKIRSPKVIKSGMFYFSES